MKPKTNKLIFLTEEYPESFSMNIFNEIKSYKKKVAYAAERLQKLSSGSGRVVFKIDNEKVLKLAKNEKGLAQNQVESGGYNLGSIIVSEVFDYDSHHDRPYWLEMELAKKISPSRFEQLLGFSLNSVKNYLFYKKNKTYRSTEYYKKLEAKLDDLDDNEWIAELMDLIANMDLMCPGDFGRASTYGEVNRIPKVIVIDYGLDDYTFDQYYNRRMR